MDLAGIPLVDHHAHGILRATPSLDEFRGLLSESDDPRQWPHIATSVTYRRAIRVLAAFFAVEPTERAVHEHRLGSDPAAYAAALLCATGTEFVLLDDGFPPPAEAIGGAELGELAGCPARPVLRIERVAQEGGADAVRAAVATARADGFAGLKTIAAYRGGLDLAALDGGRPGRVQGGRPGRVEGGRPGRVEGRAMAAAVLTALEANEATGDPLPVQVHTGFGDADLQLARADPSLLKPVIERFRETPFVLLHCYPFVRAAGWLAHVYANVFFDLSLTIPHVARPAEALREALELAPVSKLLYASDAARTPELYYLAATWWREALGQVLPELLPAAEAEEAAHLILRENARRLYRL